MATIPPNDPNRQGTTSARVPVLIALFGVLLFGAWWFLKHKSDNGNTTASTSTSSPANSSPAGRVALRLHGSNTIGAALGPALVVGYLKSVNATDIQTVPLREEELAIKATLPGESSPVVVEIFAHGSKTAFKDLADKSCDIGMASRSITPEEVASTSALGDLKSRGSEHVLGMDGVAVIVNRSNVVTGLTKDQLAAIYSGAITDWSEVDGTPGPIHVMARNEESGTWDTFKSLVLKDKPLVASASRIEDSRELSGKVSADRGAIGFIGMPYVLDAKAVAISETEKAGGNVRRTTPLFPNRLTVATEDYPLSRRLYLYTSENPSNPWTEKFVNFAISKAGQDIVGNNGFISQTPVSVATDCNACPSEYRKLTSGKNRLTLDFRFESGQFKLDNKAWQNISTIADTLADLKYNGTGVVLMGFADNRGSEQANLALSQQRADAVAGELHMRGVNPEVVRGMGIIMPIATNDDPAGREKNRRVEIWVNR
jgi:phosphate transport system substrate-binding protein